MRPGRRSGPPPPPIGRYIGIGLLLVTLFIVGWFWLYPDDLGQVVDYVRSTEPKVKQLTLTINGQQRDLKPGQFARIHPLDQVSVDSFSSNRIKNYNLRLYSPDFDIGLLDRPVALARIMGEEDFAQPRQLTVQVKEGPKVLADFFMLVSMTVMDWLIKAEQATTPEKKIEYYRRAMTLDPKDRNLRHNLAGLLTDAREFQAAADLYEKSFGEEPTATLLRDLLFIYQAAGDRAKVIDTYERLIRISPAKENRNILRELLRIYNDTGELPKIEETYQRIIAASPETEVGEVRRELAAWYEERNDLPKAIGVYSELVQGLPKEHQPAIYRKIGLLSARIGDTDRAISAFEAVVKLNPQDQNALINLTRLYQIKGDKVKYAESLAKVNALTGSDSQARMLQVDAYLDAGQPDKAEAELRLIIQKDPGYTEARLRLIGLLEAKGDQVGLMAEYESLAARDPKNRVLFYNLGVLYFQNQDWEKAALRMKEALRLDPDDLTAHQYLFSIFLKQNKENEAVTEAQELLRLKSDQPDLYDYVLDHLETQGNNDRLLAVIRLGMKTYPENPAFPERLARTLAKNGRSAEAAQAYRDLFKLKPTDIQILLQAAELYEKAGQVNDAKDIYRQILGIDPSNQKAAEAHVRLGLKGLEIKSKPQ